MSCLCIIHLAKHPFEYWVANFFTFLVSFTLLSKLFFRNLLFFEIRAFQNKMYPRMFFMTNDSRYVFMNHCAPEFFSKDHGPYWHWVNDNINSASSRCYTFEILNHDLTKWLLEPMVIGIINSNGQSRFARHCLLSNIQLIQRFLI